MSESERFDGTIEGAGRGNRINDRTSPVLRHKASPEGGGRIMRTLRVHSTGLGVQSWVIHLLEKEGVIEPYDARVFSDNGNHSRSMTG